MREETGIHELIVHVHRLPPPMTVMTLTFWFVMICVGAAYLWGRRRGRWVVSCWLASCCTFPTTYTHTHTCCEDGSGGAFFIKDTLCFQFPSAGTAITNTIHVSCISCALWLGQNLGWEAGRFTNRHWKCNPLHTETTSLLIRNRQLFFIQYFRPNLTQRVIQMFTYFPDIMFGAWMLTVCVNWSVQGFTVLDSFTTWKGYEGMRHSVMKCYFHL